MAQPLMFFLYFSIQTAFATPVCQKLFDPLAQRIESLKDALSEPTETVDEQTVFYEGPTAPQDGRFILRRAPSAPWRSSKILSGGATIQGDPRNPIYTLGPELAGRFGFEIQTLSDGSRRIYVPDSRRLAKTIKKLNEVLKSLGFEPIAYLPVGAGFLSASELLNLASKTRGDFNLFFPFSHRDKNLSPHEAAYHLTALLLTRKILEPAQKINEKTLEFIQFLKTQSPLKFDAIQKISAALIEERALDLDFGTGNLAASLSEIRRHDFRGIGSHHSKINFFPRLLIRQSIGLLARPELRPVEAVIVRLSEILDSPSLRFGFGLRLPRDFSYQKRKPVADLSFTEKVQIRWLVWKYLKEFSRDELRQPVDRSTEEEVAEEFLGGLYQRLEELKKAFEVLDAVTP